MTGETNQHRCSTEMPSTPLFPVTISRPLSPDVDSGCRVGVGPEQGLEGGQVFWCGEERLALGHGDALAPRRLQPWEKDGIDLRLFRWRWRMSQQLVMCEDRSYSRRPHPSSPLIMSTRTRARL
jgi:hypothetical protein